MGEAKKRRMALRFAPPEDLRFPAWAAPFLEHVSSLVWNELQSDGTARGYRNVQTSMTVLFSGLIEADGKRWLHVSFAHTEDRLLPTWDELKLVKETFIGKHKKAVQVFPCEAEYVNVNPYCLHLWHCLDGDGLPDFTAGRPKGQI